MIVRSLLHYSGTLNMLEKNEKMLTPTLEAVSSSVGGEQAEKVLQIIKKFGPIKHSEENKLKFRHYPRLEPGNDKIRAVDITVEF